MITRNFRVYLNAGVGSAPYINVSQYDSGETWVFELFTDTGEAYTPSSGSIVGIKSDGMVIANAGTVTDGKVVITETQQMTAAAGKAIYELQIDSDTHGTANFIVMVEKSPMDGGTLSESDISLYQGLLNITPTNSGTAGQVLTRTASGSQWADGGGGGSTGGGVPFFEITTTNMPNNPNFIGSFGYVKMVDGEFVEPNYAQSFSTALYMTGNTTVVWYTTLPVPTLAEYYMYFLPASSVTPQNLNGGIEMVINGGNTWYIVTGDFSLTAKGWA